MDICQHRCHAAASFHNGLSQTEQPSRSLPMFTYCRASDFFQDWWAEVTHGAKNDGSFSEMMGPSISN